MVVIVVMVFPNPAAGVEEEAGIVRFIPERSGLPSLLDEMLDIYSEGDQSTISTAWDVLGVLVLTLICSAAESTKFPDDFRAEMKDLCRYDIAGGDSL